MMKSKRILSCLMVGVFCMGLLSSCVRLPWDFRSSEEAQTYVLSTLKRKYDESFVFVEEPTYKEEQIGIRWISGKVAPENNPDQVATVYARNTALFEDNYHVYYFADRLIELAKPLLDGKDYIKEVKFDVQGRGSGGKWTGEESVDEYIEQGEYDIIVDVYLYEDLTDEVYVEQVCDLIRTISDCGLHIRLDIWDQPEEWIFRAYADDGALVDNPEDILDKTQSHRSLRESKDDYEAWKAEQQTQDTGENEG